MSKLFFYDVETTGTQPWKNAMHQIAGMIKIGDEIKEEFNFKLAPHKEAIIEEQALAVSNVTREQIMGYPEHTITYKQILSMMGKYVDKFNKTDKFHLVGYNNKGFDNDFMRNFFKLCNDNYYGSWFWADTIDVLVLASDYLQNERGRLVDFKLRTVAAYLGIEVDESLLHDALYDIRLTMAIYDVVKRVK